MKQIYLKIFILEPETHFDNTKTKYLALQEFSSVIKYNEFFPKELCEITHNPELADFIFVPFFGDYFSKLGLIGMLDLFSRCDIYIKYYWKFIFMYRDDCSWKIPMGGTWLRASYDKNILSDESIPIPYLVSSNKYIDTDICKQRANFVGALHTHPIRDKLVQFLVDEKLLEKVFIIIRKEFHSELMREVWGGTEFEKRKKQASIAANNSFITLCPRGTGLNSIRFYETMSNGRIPMLISENCRLPLDDIINYEEFCFKIMHDQMSEIHSIVNTKEAELTEMCKRSNEIHKEFLSIEKFGFRLVNYLKKKRNEIHERRKKDKLFDINLNNEDVFDYIFKSLLTFVNQKESTNILAVATLLKKMTKDEKITTNLDFIIRTSSNACITTNVDYEKYITSLPFEFDNISASYNYNFLTDSYFESIFGTLN